MKNKNKVKIMKEQPQPKRQEGFFEVWNRAGEVLNEMGNVAFDLV